MGFYIEAKTKDGHTFASKSFRVMDPNVKHFYSAFGLEEPGPDDWSGDGRKLKLSVNQLKQARVYLSKTEFYNKVDNTRLHPLVSLFSSLDSSEIDGEKDKEFRLKFLDECI
ncbi:hypothetical protein ACERII_11540 [Evansella sp. AB-rgal1]|uniref:hypothetical protein n=1 Tax=Evansella sp. AB-rgal1 TaxID=3242696 RepID=UPI00359D30B0